MNTEQIKVEYLDHMGSDLMVVNAARTSFGKESDWGEVRTEVLTDETQAFDNGINYRKVRERTHFILKPEDANLIRYLATGYRTSEWNEFLNSVIGLVQYGLDTNDLEQAKANLTPLLHAYKRRAQHWAPFAHPHLSLRMQLPMFLARQFVKHQIGGVWSEESRRYISDEPGVWFPDEWHSRPEDIKQGSGNTHENSDMWGQAAHEHAKNAVGFYTQAVGSGVAPRKPASCCPSTP